MTIIFARESLTPELQSELPALQEQHRKEVSPFAYLGSGVDWKQYGEVQKTGNIFFFTARDQGKLVGYVDFLTHRHLRYNLICASCDALFLLPEYRKGFAGMKLISYSEAELKKAGVDLIIQCSTGQPDLGRLFTRMGYEEGGITMAKVLKPHE